MQRVPPASLSLDAKLFGILLAGMFGRTRQRDASESRLKIVAVARDPAEAETDEPERED